MQGIPDIYIIGAQKAATTSLFHALSKSDEITASQTKEPEHFTQGNAQDYASLFKGNGLKMEATPSGYSDTFMDRLKKANPQCKLIYILRNPTDRAWSAWSMYVKTKQIDGDFYTKCLNDIENAQTLNDNNDKTGIVRRGNYVKHISKAISLGLRIKVVSFDRLINDPESELKDIINYLGVKPFNTKLGRQNTGSGKAIPENAKTLLDEHYAEVNKNLVSYIGFKPY